jgi:hypothetical protein
METGRVSLSEIAESLLDGAGELTHILDRQTGEVLIVPEDAERDLLEWAGASPAEIDELEDVGFALDEFDPARFVRIPGPYERHELHAMRAFARSRPPGPDAGRLLDATYGRGLYRRFKDEAYRQGVQDDWFAFRLRHVAPIARKWATDKAVTFIDDLAEQGRGTPDARDLDD